MQNIRTMFESATLKLTIWYLVGIMAVSIMFSFLVYHLALGELSSRLGVIGLSLEERGGLSTRFNYKTVQEHQYEAAADNLLTILVYSNIVIFGIASIGSYLWARQTLLPIEEAHEAQSRFTSDASHELRTPLAIMQSEIEMVLRDKSATKHDLREILHSNLEEITRLSELSALLLKLAQLESSSLSYEEINLHKSLQEAIHTLPKSVQPRIVIQKNKQTLKIQANRHSIKELLILLLDNAVKYSPDKSTVTVRLFRERGKCCISIENTGKGIPEKDIDSIFHRFYRTDTARARSESTGYGLGLSLAKKIVELHHGEISVRSVPGEFTKFTLKFSS